MAEEYFKYKELLNPPIRRAAYSDRTAWLMAEMSQLAYLKFEDDPSELQAALAMADFQIVGQPFNRFGTQAFLARRDSDKMAVLSFRGTQMEGLTLETLLDVCADLYATFQTDENGVKTHNGFRCAFQKIEKEVMAGLEGLKDYAIYITGHSLGGALALIATRASNSDNLAACYTFGSPKVGNEEFGDAIKAPIYRIVNAFDLVPLLPFTWIMKPIIWLAGKKISKAKIKALLENFQKYRHQGDQRFFTNAPERDAKVLTEYSEFFRSLQLLRCSFMGSRDIGVQHHDLKQYRNKLAQRALKRSNA